jgi:hypothetical protein
MATGFSFGALGQQTGGQVPSFRFGQGGYAVPVINTTTTTNVPDKSKRVKKPRKKVGTKEAQAVKASVTHHKHKPGSKEYKAAKARFQAAAASQKK